VVVVDEEWIEAARQALWLRRQDLGWTQKKVAVLVGVTQSMISEWEQGQHTPSLAAFLRWATALGVETRLVADQPA
jgi:transcriptional regulator with XRE-family HTH domain